MKRIGNGIVFTLMASFLMSHAAQVGTAQKLSNAGKSFPVAVADCFQITSSKVGIFTVGTNAFFRDKYGHIGLACEIGFEKRMYASGLVSLHYEILWENGTRTKHVSDRFFPGWSTDNKFTTEDFMAVGFQDFRGLVESRMNITMPQLAEGEPYYTSFSTANK